VRHVSDRLNTGSPFAKQQSELIGIPSLHLRVEECLCAIVIRIAQDLALGLEAKSGCQQLLAYEGLINAVFTLEVAGIGIAKWLFASRLGAFDSNSK
jgi:hypothetical protein